jgi:ABC-type Fe3+/spermidine/putrescine transport system ATPase subunit
MGNGLAALEAPDSGTRPIRTAAVTDRPILEVRDIAKSYPGTTALKGVSLDVRAGEFLALVGPSGSGKSTLLKIIGGFEAPTSGCVLIDGRDVSQDEPAKRPTSMVFQRLALFPHMTVARNIGFPLKLRKLPAAEIRQRVEAMMQLMHLRAEYAQRYPAQLSGGEQQRAALARSMISSPRILLLDEPLSALDAKLRKNLQAELRALHRELGVTFIHVTHDLEEAMILADRICVMRQSEIVQIGSPADIYHRPHTAFVASFIGETNLIPIRIIGMADSAAAYESAVVSDPRPSLSRAQIDAAVDPGAALMMVRPEHLRPIAQGHAECRITARIAEIFLKGSIVQYRALSAPADLPLVFEIQGVRAAQHRIGEEVVLGFQRADAFVLPEGER